MESVVESKQNERQTPVLRSGVEVRAYNEENTLIFQQFINDYSWYEGDIPLLDDPDEVKARYHVNYIEGEQYNGNGEMIKKWRNMYNNLGQPVQFLIWHGEFPEGRWEEDFIEGLDLDPVP